MQLLKNMRFLPTFNHIFVFSRLAPFNIEDDPLIPCLLKFCRDMSNCKNWC
jgi:hypothetical protein